MGGSPHKAPLKFFFTDYENFDISYSCTDTGYGMTYETFALAARDPNPSPEALEKAKKIIKERIPQYDLDTYWNLHWTKQNAWCKYDWKFDTKQ